MNQLRSQSARLRFASRQEAAAHANNLSPSGPAPAAAPSQLHIYTPARVNLRRAEAGPGMRLRQVRTPARATAGRSVDASDHISPAELASRRTAAARHNPISAGMLTNPAEQVYKQVVTN